jgi:hypothetical protein
VNGSSTTATCTFNPVTGTETCNFTGACTGTASGTATGISSNSVTCQGSASTQALASVARGVSQAGLTVVQSQLTTIRDRIQRRLQAVPNRPLGYAEEPGTDAFAYTDPKSPNLKNTPLYLKAPPAAAPDHGWAVWAQSFFDYENRFGIENGFDTGRNTRTGGMMGGIDKTFTGVFSSSDALVIGLLGGGLGSGVHNADGSTAKITGSSIGAYAVWVNGATSLDTTFKTDFLDIDQTAGGATTTLGLNNYTWAGNVNYKVEMPGWWFEPTLGVSDTVTIWNSASSALGLTDGNAVRIQGGSRFGTTFDWGRTPVDATLTGLLYDDVSITGGTLSTAVAGTSLVPTDEGKVFGQVIGKLNFDWGKDIKGLSSYIETEIRGRSGVIGTAARLGVRYAW